MYKKGDVKVRIGRSADRDTEETVFNLYVYDAHNNNLIIEIQLDSENLANVITCANPGIGTAAFFKNTYEKFNKQVITKDVFVPIKEYQSTVDIDFLNNLSVHEVDGWECKHIYLDDKLNIKLTTLDKRYKVTLNKTVHETGPEEKER